MLPVHTDRERLSTKTTSAICPLCCPEGLTEREIGSWQLIGGFEFFFLARSLICLLRKLNLDTEQQLIWCLTLSNVFFSFGLSIVFRVCS